MKHGKLIILILSFLLVFTMIPMAGTAFADPEDGEENENLPYELGSCGLEITAEFQPLFGGLFFYCGELASMDDYDGIDPPWAEYKDATELISFSGDIDYIGYRAFADMKNLQRVEFHGKVNAYGGELFKGCPDNVVFFYYTENDDELKLGKDSEVFQSIKRLADEYGYTAEMTTWEDIYPSEEDEEAWEDDSDDGYVDDDPGDGPSDGDPIDGSDEEYYDDDDEGDAPDQDEYSHEVPISRDFKDAEISGFSKQMVYTGKAIKQNIKVETKSTYGNMLLLEEGVDYEIIYKNNKNVGTATMTVKGIGWYNYTETEKTFKIRPQGTKITKITTKKAKGKKPSITVKWTKKSKKMSKKRITGYQIMRATNSKFTKNKKTYTIKGYKNNSKTFTGLKSKKTYYFKIRTYKKIGDKTYYSKWSKYMKKKAK